jgi:hypothetical protein
VSDNPAFGEEGRVRAGWRLTKDPHGKDKWVPVADAPSARLSVAPPAADLDMSLEASHRRMQATLALETNRLETAARSAALSEGDIEVLGRLTLAWRTLVQNEPTADYGDLTDEQLKAKLAEVKRR